MQLFKDRHVGACDVKGRDRNIPRIDRVDVDLKVGIVARDGLTLLAVHIATAMHEAVGVVEAALARDANSLDDGWNIHVEKAMVMQLLNL